MRFQFLLIPAAIIAAAPVQAKVFMTRGEAQQLLFPGAQFTPRFVTLTESQARSIARKADAPVHMT